ncbi:hypothetical protein [Streptacidiphilus carbonis]|uniref:hypothetical protein n=1 Tax=Streptacidiphilus carbonis TaxID=105422 RepID=UPI0005A8A956|nr:hypothetical protein [Streptacidiphilus carbonis]
MPTFVTLVTRGADTLGAGAALYALTITTIALAAVAAPNAQRRHDARTVLKILMRRTDRNP